MEGHFREHLQAAPGELSWSCGLCGNPEADSFLGHVGPSQEHLSAFAGKISSWSSRIWGSTNIFTDSLLLKMKACVETRTENLTKATLGCQGQRGPRTLLCTASQAPQCSEEWGGALSSRQHLLLDCEPWSEVSGTQDPSLTPP